MGKPNPFVSVVIPCRNEDRHIGQCLDSLLQSDYPKESLEVLVVDGNSTDRTCEIVESYSRRHGFIRLLHNPKGLTAAALNRGIEAAKGEIIVRMDGHSAFEPSYISKCVELLDQHQADNIGGVIETVPGKRTLLAQAIALALSHPFGVGSSRFRTARKTEPPQEVDTVPFGCFRRSLFEKIGLFDENLPQWKGRCNEDFDLNHRIRAAGGKILLSPAIESRYFARGTLREFCAHAFNNGVLVTLPLGSNSADFSFRHLVPMFFVLGLGTGALLSVFGPLGRIALTLMLAPYLTVSLYFAVKRAMTKRDVRLFFVMPAVFFLLHSSYGLGSLYGMVKAAQMKLKWARSP